MIEFDESTEYGRRALRRLREEPVIWFTTVREDGTPQPVPVWFVWQGDHFLIYSRPKNQKLRNIEREPRAALNFNSDEDGDDVIVFFGEATIDPGAPPAGRVAEYVEKYREGMRSLGMTPESFAGEYSVPIRVRPTYVHGH